LPDMRRREENALTYSRDPHWDTHNVTADWSGSTRVADRATSTRLSNPWNAFTSADS
jgi:hypothetical protein